MGLGGGRSLDHWQCVLGKQVSWDRWLYRLNYAQPFSLPCLSCYPSAVCPLSWPSTCFHERPNQWGCLNFYLNFQNSKPKETLFSSYAPRISYSKENLTKKIVNSFKLVYYRSVPPAARCACSLSNWLLPYTYVSCHLGFVQTFLIINFALGHFF